jgi:hypothetical protein
MEILAIGDNRDRVVKLIEVNCELCSNQEHFESDIKQVIEHYTCILDEKEISWFIDNVLTKIFKRDFHKGEKP